MAHVNDEDLILHFYGEGGGPEEQRVDAHLRDCAACHAMWLELSETLKMVDSASVPEPGPAFERVVWARLQPEIAASAPSGVSWWRRSFVPMTAAVAAALAGAVSLGYFWRHAQTSGPAEQSAVVMPANPSPKPGGQARARERVLLSALNEHFEQTELFLVELMNTPASSAEALTVERATADDLVSSGRLYRITAEQTGDLQFAQMLEDIESVLVDIARSSGRPNRKEMQSLRARIENADLLFKVRAVTNAIHIRQKDLMSADD